MLLVLVPVFHPLRMMLLHPGMVVPNPPVAVMPRVMIVVVTHDGRSLVYDGGSAVHIRRPRTSVRVRSVRRLISMPSTEKTCLESNRSDHENRCLQGRENFARQFAGQLGSHGSCPSTKRRSIKDASQKTTANRAVSRNRTSAGNPNLPGSNPKTARRKNYFAERITLAATGFTARPAFCSVA
jgi:hypothetical protein